MRIEHLDIEAFGRLSALEGTGEPLPSLVVVLGPNEAGKSTVFEFLTTMLYGFLPASRDLNPFVPWGSDEARGSLRIRMHDGSAATVTRRLRSQPLAQLEVGGRTTDLRNQPVPWVEHVPRRVFRQVFAVTLGELASLDEETWARIQDRVVGSMGASDLLPVRGVAQELEKEAGELWRPSRRGNQRVRDARDRMRALRARRRDALEHDRVLRARVEELERVQRLLKAKRDRRATDEAVLERARLLRPIRAQLHRIAALREEAGPEEPLLALPPGPADRLAALESDIARQREVLGRIEADRALPEREAAALTPEVRTLLDRKDEIGRFVSSTSRIVADKERAVELDSDVGSLTERLERICADLTGSAGSQADVERLLRVRPGALRASLARLERAQQQAADTEPWEEPGSEGEEPAGVGATIGALLATLTGLGLVAWGFLAGAPAWTASGAAVATAGAAGAWSLVRERKRRTASSRERSRRAGRRNTELANALRAVRDVIGDAPFAERHQTEPDASLADALERLEDLRERLRGKTRTLEEVTARIESSAREGRALAAKVLEGTVPELGPEELAAVLSDRLRGAERVEQAATAAARELARLDRAHDQAIRALESDEAELAALLEAADPFGDGSPGERLAEATRRLEALEQARTLEAELHRSHPDLAVLRVRVEEAEREGARWLTDEREVATRRTRITELQSEIEELKGRADGLEAEIRHARGQETADWVDGEIATLEEETEAMVRERDRKWVLARLLREADRRFREEHQPDLMRRASSFLAHLTGGRYDRILVEETDERDLFRIAGPELAGPIPLRHPISTGTLEQAYLSLRLAIVDHLDQGVESLPLFIDEIFVNWDAERRARGLEVIANIAEHRQVFVFTCHPYVARELEDAGARRIELTRA